MSFKMAKLASGGGIPPVKEKTVAASQSFYLGALLLEDGSGNWAECGANPASIGGVAESDYLADTTGFSHLGRTEFPPGKMQATLVSATREFTAEFEGTLPANPGGLYNVIRSSDGKWRVNFALQTATRVKYLGPKEPIGTVKHVRCEIIAANVQQL